MTHADPGHDVWSRLRALCEDHRIDLSWDEDWYRWHGDGIRDLRCFPPASDEQVRATEEQLGFALPADLRHLYTEVANGGIHLGPVTVFFGAIGGCPVNPGWRPHTVADLANDTDWQLHPRIEEALLRHPRHYIVAESTPASFLWIGDGGCSIGLEINVRTGGVYHTEYWDDLPDPSGKSSAVTSLISLQAVAPSLSTWFVQWLDGTWLEHFESDGPLLPEMVETSDLPDPEVVWRGLYRFGPDWRLQPDETDLAQDAAHAIYWTYVEDAEREQNARYAYGASRLEEPWEPPEGRFVDES